MTNRVMSKEESDIRAALSRLPWVDRVEEYSPTGQLSDADFIFITVYGKEKENYYYISYSIHPDFMTTEGTTAEIIAYFTAHHERLLVELAD